MNEIIREKNIFEKAKQISFKEYEHDFIYDPKTERYFEEIDILEEYYESEELELPDYVYGCIPIEFGLDMCGIVENELQDNHYEGAIDHISDDSLNNLQKIVDKWIESQGIVSYEQDYNTVILLEK